MLTDSQRAYLRKILNSGLFDRRYYLAENPGVHWLFRLFPARHFVLMGEGAGLPPNRAFSPWAYLRHNPDVAQSSYRPFEHYDVCGRKEQQLTQDHPEAALAADCPLSQQRGWLCCRTGGAISCRSCIW